MYSLIVLNSAKIELKNAIDFYNTRQLNLGKEFFLATSKLIITIQSNPKLFIKVKKEYRQALISKFPFVIIYKIDERKKIIVIMSFFHTSRNPNKKFKNHN